MSSDRHTPPVDGRPMEGSEFPTQAEVTGKSQKMTPRASTGPDSQSVPLQYSTPLNNGKSGSHRMNTINNSSGKDGYGSDSHPMQPPPTQSMFNSLYDDSDGSDGRYVHNLVP